jgi:hypothetical protein
MKQPVINHKDLYEFLPETGKRLIAIIGHESAFTLMREIGGKTHNNAPRKQSNFYKCCANVLGDLEAYRVVSLLSTHYGKYVYIPSLKPAILAQEKSTTRRAMIEQYKTNIAGGMKRLAALNALSIQFGVATRTASKVIKGACDA